MFNAIHDLELQVNNTLVTDDTAAINAAMSHGNRCGGYGCIGATINPAIVYFPPGTYLISSPIVGLFYTQMIGDPTDMPVIKGGSNFTQDGKALLDADPYLSNGSMCGLSTPAPARLEVNLFLSCRAQFHLYQCLLPTGPQPGVRYHSHTAPDLGSPLAICPGYCHSQLCLQIVTKL